MGLIPLGFTARVAGALNVQVHLGTSGYRSLLILFACSGILYAQGTNASQSAVAEACNGSRDCYSFRTNIRVDSTLVQVPVSVMDRRGGLIHGLSRGAFRIFEDGVEQEVSAFSGADVPVSVGLIFDASGSMEAKLPMARLAVAQFLKTANPEDDFFFLPFDSRPWPVSGLTNNVEVILSEVDRIQANGDTALLDAVYAGLTEIKRAPNSRRVLLIISDGEDNTSRYTERAVHTAVRESDVQIYAMGVHQIVYSGRGRRLNSRGAELLRNLCLDTGGRSFELDDVRDLPDVAAKIGLEIRNEYLLGYRPTNQNWDGKYRNIALKLNQSPGFPHLRANWRRGYYAQGRTGQ